jgi:hypothetical protein
VEERKTERESKRERERERESERERKCHPNRFPRMGVLSLGHCPYRLPNWLARHPQAKWSGTLV